MLTSNGFGNTPAQLSNVVCLLWHCAICLMDGIALLPRTRRTSLPVTTSWWSWTLACHHHGGATWTSSLRPGSWQEMEEIAQVMDPFKIDGRVKSWWQCPGRSALPRTCCRWWRNLDFDLQSDIRGLAQTFCLGRLVGHELHQAGKHVRIATTSWGRSSWTPLAGRLFSHNSMFDSVAKITKVISVAILAQVAGRASRLAAA